MNTFYTSTTSNKFPSITTNHFYSQTNLSRKHNNNNNNDYYNESNQLIYLHTVKSPIIRYSRNKSSHFKLQKTQNHFNTKIYPTLQETQQLSSYYKTSEDYDDKYKFNIVNHKKSFSFQEKEHKKLLYNKFNIKKPKITLSNKPFQSIDNNNSNSNNIHNKIKIKIKKPFFKSYHKAHKTININQQIALKVTQASNAIQIQHYNKNIHQIQDIKYYLNKMPKIRIKKTDTANQTIVNPKKNSNSKNNINNNILIDTNPITINDNDTIITDNNNNNNPNYNSLQTVTNHIITYSISFHFKAYKPTSRSQYSLNLINQNIYLFGGLNSKYNNDMWCYSLQTHQWNIIKVNEMPVPRYGHTSIIMDDYLVIYGGVTPDNYCRMPERVLVFNTRNHKFIEPKITTKLYPGNRKGHIALAISQTMFIHGGYDQDTNQIKSNAFLYHILKGAWSEFDCTGEPLPCLMNHSAVIVNDFANKTLFPYSIYKLPEDLPSNRIPKAKVEGIYLFGGVNDKKRYSNELYVIKICRKPCVVVKPKVKGKPPVGRINCKMFYMHEMNILIVHGGCGEGQNVLNDVMVLNIENLNWIRPVIEEDDIEREIKMYARTEHEGVVVGRKVLILGGRDIESYHKMDFEVVVFHVNQLMLKLKGEE